MRKTEGFEGEGFQKSIKFMKNQCKIDARKSDAEMMRNEVKMPPKKGPKMNPRHTQNRSNPQGNLFFSHLGGFQGVRDRSIPSLCEAFVIRGRFLKILENLL